MSNSSLKFKSEYFGEESTSTAGIDLIQKWKLIPSKSLVANSFNFIAKQDCTIIMNGSDPIPFKANRELIIDIGSNPIHKPLSEFRIVEANIGYWCMGVFDD